MAVWYDKIVPATPKIRSILKFNLSRTFEILFALERLWSRSAKTNHWLSIKILPLLSERSWEVLFLSDHNNHGIEFSKPVNKIDGCQFFRSKESKRIYYRIVSNCIELILRVYKITLQFPKLGVSCVFCMVSIWDFYNFFWIENR